MTVILYLIGNPGTGKYTIAKEIAKHDYRICDNQLINTPICSLLNYNGLNTIPEFAWAAIRNIRQCIFDFLSLEPNNNYVLTNCLYEYEGDRKIFAQVEQMAMNRQSIFVPVKLLISQEENVKRIQNIERLNRFKSIDIKDASPDLSLLNIIHPNLLTLDVTELKASYAAQLILLHIQNLIDNTN